MCHQVTGFDNDDEERKKPPIVRIGYHDSKSYLLTIVHILTSNSFTLCSKHAHEHTTDYARVQTRPSGHITRTEDYVKVDPPGVPWTIQGTAPPSTWRVGTIRISGEKKI